MQTIPPGTALEALLCQKGMVMRSSKLAETNVPKPIASKEIDGSLDKPR